MATWTIVAVFLDLVLEFHLIPWRFASLVREPFRTLTITFACRSRKKTKTDIDEAVCLFLEKKEWAKYSDRGLGESTGR
jgi:hypothetical protein